MSGRTPEGRDCPRRPRGERAVEALVGALSDATIRYHAMNAIHALGPERVTPRATSLLDHPDPLWRVSAAETLGALRERSALAPLLRALRSGEPRLRRVAAETLVRIGIGDAVEPLLAAAGEEDPELQNAALWALAEIGDPRALPTLLDRASEAVLESRLVAIAGLRRFPSPRSRRVLEEALSASHLRVRLYAAESLLHLGDPAGRRGVLSLLASPDRDSRWLAAKALAGVRGPARRDVAAEACPPLFDLLGSDRPDDRYLALLTLRRIRSDVPAALRDRLRTLVEPLLTEPEGREGRLAAEILRDPEGPRSGAASGPKTGRP